MPLARGTQGASKELCATEWPDPKVNWTQSPSAAVKLSGVKVRPGPTWTSWTPETDAAAAETVVVADESPYCGEARTDVASTETRRVVDEMMECILKVCFEKRDQITDLGFRRIEE